MRRFKQAYQLARVLTLPGGARAALRWKPFSITAFQMMRALREQGFRFATILDGGANVGQFARAAVENYPDARLIAVEPLPDIASRLRDNLRDRSHVRVIQTALGSRDGTILINRNAYSLASSVLAMRPTTAAAFPGLEEVEVLEVPVVRVDSMLAGTDLIAPFLMKLDLQGYELEALRGAECTLARTDYLLLELAFQSQYESEPGFEAILDFVRAAGFRFLRPVDFLKDSHGIITQMDALFAREE